MSVKEKLYAWTPHSEELDIVRWIDRPKWAFSVPGMQEQVIEKSSQHISQWALSTATLRNWAWLLARMLDVGTRSGGNEGCTGEEGHSRRNQGDGKCRYLVSPLVYICALEGRRRKDPFNPDVAGTFIPSRSWIEHRRYVDIVSSPHLFTSCYFLANAAGAEPGEFGGVRFVE